MKRHQCPTCTCVDPDRVVMNPSAPFFQLVIDIDKLIYASYISRRTATRRANQTAAA